MTTQQIEAYSHYKELYPEAILLFHYGNSFVALMEDATKIAQILHRSESQRTIAFPDNDESLIENIFDLAGNVRMIEYRNNDGIYDFPDIQALRQASIDDY